MPTFEVMIPATIFKAWPEGKVLEVMDVKVTLRKGSKFNLEIFTRLAEQDEQSALVVARKRIEDALNFVSVCVGDQMQVVLSKSEDRIREISSEVWTGTSRIAMSATLTDSKPIDESAFPAVESGYQNLTKLPSEDLELTKTVLRWRDKGIREENRIDKFLAYWISLEILVHGRGKDVKIKVVSNLTKATPHIDEAKTKDVVGRIYGVRGDIVHVGVMEHAELEIRTNQLKEILDALTRAKIGLTESQVLPFLA